MNNIVDDSTFQERIIRGLRKKVQELHELSDAKDLQVRESVSKASVLSDRLSEKDVNIRALGADIERLERQIAVNMEELSRLQGEVRERNLILAGLEAELKEKEGLLANNARELDYLTRQLNDTTEQLNDTTGRLNDTTGRLNDTTGRLNDTTGRLNDTTGRLNDTTRQLNEMASHLQYAQKVLADVYSSRTWRTGQFFGRCVRVTGLPFFIETGRKFYEVLKTHQRIIRNEGLSQYLFYAYRYRRRWLAEKTKGLFHRLTGKGEESSGGVSDPSELNYLGLQDAFRNQLQSTGDGAHIHKLLEDLQYKGIVVYPAPITWNVPLYQRPHHLLKELSQRGYLVFYITPDAASDEVKGFREIGNNLYLVSDLDCLGGLGQVPLYLWITWTPALVCREFFREGVLVYDWIDELDVFYPYCGLMEADHKRLLKEADIVITSSMALAEKARAVRYDVVLARNGVNIDDFITEKKMVPGDLAAIVGAKKPVIGFYGSLEAWRMDYDLINYLCRVCGEYNFVFIGPSYDGSSSRLAKSENLFLLGPKKYDELRHYLAFFDVAIIPYLVGRITHSVFPVKLCEYMAAGKPVVSTDIRECREIGEVFISKDFREFADNIRGALAIRNDDAFVTKLKEVASANTWQKRVDDIVRAFGRVIKGGSVEGILASKAVRTKGIVICPPTVDWNLPLFQRPHHLALQLSRLGYLTFYCTGNHSYDSVVGFRQLEENLYLTDRYEQVTRETRDAWVIVPSISSVSLANMKGLKEKGFGIIYDYLDEINADISGSLTSYFAERHRLLDSGLVDLVLTISARLGDEMKKRFPEERVIYLPNGVDYDHFHRERDIRNCPLDLMPLVEEKKPIIGYHGALARWIDYDLINSVAEKRPGWNIVLIGWNYDGSMSRLQKRDNIRYMGLKQYHELPYYSIWFDVAIIPFMEGDIAKATSPIKLFEYMAMNKPTVVTRDLIECRGAGVFRGDGEDAFIANIETALSMASDASFVATVDSEARSNTWEVRANLLDREMDRIRGTKTPRFAALIMKKWGIKDLAEVTDPVHRMWIEWALSTFDRGEGIRELVSRYTEISGKRCMDVGCGYGGFLVAFLRAGASEAIGLELNPVYFDYYEAISADTCTDLRVNKADVQDMRTLEGLGKFDIITCNDVIEHVGDTEATLTNMAAMLEPGGMMFMQIPNRFNSGFIEADGHFKLFGITLLPGWMADVYHSIYFPGSVHDVRYASLRYYLNILRKNGLSCTVAPPAWAHRQEKLEEIRRTLERCLVSVESLDDRIPCEIKRKIGDRLTEVNALFLHAYDRYGKLRTEDPSAADTLADRLILIFGVDFWQILCRKEGPQALFRP